MQNKTALEFFYRTVEMVEIHYQLRSTVVVVIMVKLLLLLLQGWSCEACLEEDRVALLRLKDSFNAPYGGFLEEGMISWRKEVDCCEWDGVGCDTTTGRVNKLMLRGFRYGDSVDNWYFNASVFLPFQELRNLSLAFNHIVCCVENEGFEKLQKLSKLEYLDLGYNDLNVNILPLLRGLQSLRGLYIYHTQQNGSINMGDLVALSNLEELDISENNFNKFVVSKDIEGLSNISILWIDIFGSNFQLQLLRAFPDLKSLQLYGNFMSREPFSQGLSNFKNLKELYLESCVLENINSFLEGIANMTSLETLSMHSCQLIGNTRDTGGLCELKNLRNLVLSDNNLTGVLPHYLVNLTLLQKLDLSQNYFSGNIRGTEGLCEMKNLQNLILSDNNLSGALPHCLVNLTLLQELDLSDNYFSGNIRATEGLCEMKNLQNLILSDNNLSGALPHCLVNLTLLQELDLSHNYFSGNICSTKGLCEMKNLQNLVLSDNNLGGALPHCLVNLTLLQELDLSSNYFSGNIHDTESLCEKKNLRILNLYNNSLSGALPQCLMNLTLLQKLDLAHNYFSGNVLHSPLIGLTSITSLSLSHNQLKFPSSLSPFLNHSKLKTFIGDENEIYTETRMVNHSLIPKFQLKMLSLQSTFRGGLFPEFLYHQHDLQSLYISGIPMIKSGFPSWLLENNTKLEYLSLSNCSLFGSMILPAHTPNATLRMLDISTNQLHGRIPIEIGTSFPRLESLYLSENRFIGSIPNSLSNCSFLEVLDVRDNQLFGKVPKWIGIMDSLLILDLAKNKFSGSLSATLGAPWLQFIRLSKNKFEGPFPHSISNLHNLKFLDLSYNYLTGIIPKWVEKLFELEILRLNYNNFTGEIPINLWMMKNSLIFVDISYNKLSSFFTNHSYIYKNDKKYFKDASLPGVCELVVKGNVFEYKITNILSTRFIGLDFSCNNLNGPIPFELGNIDYIKLLNLSRNNLTGPIPSSFSNMTEVETLDLSFNNLNGSIPFLLLELTFLEVFNVSYNNLSGETPTTVAQFATFDETSYLGNPFLCGWPLPKSCRNGETTSSMTKESSDDGDGAIDMEVFYISFSVTFVIILAGIAGVLCINPYWRKAWFCFIEMVIDSCYYFVLDCLSYLSRLWER